MSHHGIEYPTPVVCNRVEVVDEQGHRVVQLRTARGNCYEFVRTLRDALMGKVRLAAVCSADQDHPGRFRVHYDAQNKARYVAIKEIHRACIEQNPPRTLDNRIVRENPLDEVAYLNYLGSPGHVNVLRLVEYLCDDTKLYIVLEYLDNGEVFDLVQKDGRIAEEEAKQLFWQMLQGMKYMHAMGVAHRDLSLENYMMTNTDAGRVVKVIDFGLTVPIPRPPMILQGEERPVGKERYMAPEIFACHNYDPVRADIWTLGMCLFVMLFGLYPYQRPSVELCRYFAEIAGGRLLPLLQQWEVPNSNGKRYTNLVSQPVLDLIIRILKVDPSARLTVAQIEAHPWFQNFQPSIPTPTIPPQVYHI